MSLFRESLTEHGAEEELIMIPHNIEIWCDQDRKTHIFKCTAKRWNHQAFHLFLASPIILFVIINPCLIMQTFTFRWLFRRRFYLFNNNHVKSMHFATQCYLPTQVPAFEALKILKETENKGFKLLSINMNGSLHATNLQPSNDSKPTVSMWFHVVSDVHLWNLIPRKPYKPKCLINFR